MRSILAIAAALAAFAYGGAAVVAQEAPTTPPIITVVEEPPGGNCEFGGVKVTVTPAEEPVPTPTPTEPPDVDPTPTPTPTETPEPTPTPDDGRDPPTAQLSQADPEVSYICNGQSGDPGLDGSNGFDGRDGSDGFDGQDGSNGGGNGNTVNSSARACASAGIKRMRLPARFRGSGSVTVVANGKRRSARVRGRRVRVDLRRARCGYYPVLVQRRGVRPVLKVWHLTTGRATVSSTIK